jgi:endonuclease YncB( thermonuclease family)
MGVRSAGGPTTSGACMSTGTQTVGHVTADGQNVNLEILDEGMARRYEKYDHNERLREAEQTARAAKKGPRSFG